MVVMVSGREEVPVVGQVEEIGVQARGEVQPRHGGSIGHGQIGRHIGEEVECHAVHRFWDGQQALLN
jgi:hypothetical protein